MTAPTEAGRTLLICQGTGCVSSKSPDIQAALEAEVEQLGLTGVEVKLTGCHGFCQQGPIVVVEPDGVFYAAVSSRLTETREKPVFLYAEGHISTEAVLHAFDLLLRAGYPSVSLRPFNPPSAPRADCRWHPGSTASPAPARWLQPFR